MTREQAQEQGHKHYFTGQTCRKGHASPRFVSNNVCVACKKSYDQSDKGKTDKAEQNKAYRKANPERRKIINERSRQKNLDKVLAQQREYYQKNKKTFKERNHSHYESNKSDYFRRTQLRADRLKHAGFEHEKKDIAQIYQERPEGYHVDHEIPINHNLVCGLHCVANLQYLTAEANLKKHNKFNPETYTG